MEQRVVKRDGTRDPLKQNDSGNSLVLTAFSFKLLNGNRQ
jgi:hypothetical protein